MIYEKEYFALFNIGLAIPRNCRVSLMGSKNRRTNNMQKIYFLILALFVAILLLQCRMPSVNGERPCPHPSFVTKHVCVGCSTEKEALELSNQRKKKFNKNTVLMGNPSFKMVDGMCVNAEPVPVYNCMRRQGTCQRAGKKCTTKHDTTTGHLFYREVKCN
jgi:hypothetical protein